MTTTVSHVASIAEAVRTLSRDHDLDQTLARIAEVAGRSVPGFDHVGISIVTRSGEIENRAATDPRAAQLDDLQYELGEGPCLSAMREQPVVTVPFARHDQRWPTYMPRAVAFGLRAQLASAAAWSPNPKNPPLYLDLPIGDQQQSVLARWAANAPLAFLDQYVQNLRQYRAIAIDVGDQDGLRVDAGKLHDALTSYGIANDFEIYPGTHTSDVAVRFQAHVMPFFDRTLSFEPAKK